ncbi:MAG: hypothetical protein ACYDG2_07940 [Ruminiclostridium sp.]
MDYNVLLNKKEFYQKNKNTLYSNIHDINILNKSLMNIEQYKTIK